MEIDGEQVLEPIRTGLGPSSTSSLEDMFITKGGKGMPVSWCIISPTCLQVGSVCWLVLDSSTSLPGLSKRKETVGL